MGERSRAHHSRPVSAIVTAIAFLFAATIALVPPIFVATVSWRNQSVLLGTALEQYRFQLQRLVNRNPEGWRFEQVRIHGILTERSELLQEAPRVVTAVSGDDIPVAIEGSAQPWPVMSQSADLFDGAARVGLVTVTGSFRDRLIVVLWVGLASVAASGIVFWWVRWLPMRAVAAALAEAEQARIAADAARHMAEAANQAKSQFLANMSHELRTPLNAVIGFADIIALEVFGRVEPSRYQSYAADIATSARHLLGVINNVLDVSKISAGAMRLAEEEVDLADTVGSVLRLLRVEAERAGVTLQPIRVANPIIIHADRMMISSVLVNLVGNAIKFTPMHGFVRVDLVAGVAGVQIRVTDSGIGIPVDQLDRILQPFVQVEGAFQRRYAGTGLGLSLAKAMVDMHGGSLEISSEPNRGTTVCVHLPAERWLNASPCDVEGPILPMAAGLPG